MGSTCFVPLPTARKIWALNQSSFLINVYRKITEHFWGDRELPLKRRAVTLPSWDGGWIVSGKRGCLTSSGIGNDLSDNAAALARVLLQLVVQLELVSTESEELRGDESWLERELSYSSIGSSVIVKRQQSAGRSASRPAPEAAAITCPEVPSFKTVWLKCSWSESSNKARNSWQSCYCYRFIINWLT